MRGGWGEGGCYSCRDRYQRAIKKDKWGPGMGVYSRWIVCEIWRVCYIWSSGCMTHAQWTCYSYIFSHMTFRGQLSSGDRAFDL